ncbi:Glycosyl hydrolase family 20, catalytic domain [Mariniphaga anaerophila]|uniref:beta-N-acetylhexosaminidase n=1 Tax=Mariniphaga anaerophila TaxID=1484053 RepID=A0A1M4TPX4_9BACT|nr:family 20 glycosylhydrolase [Mariniphaga anaerophila]SHE46454.1 Glycosyl hydrolase family 20, catalytic domain [Mariniphaga anaerophila]
MKRLLFIFLLIVFSIRFLRAESPYPVRGLCIAAPPPNLVDEFATFIENELVPSGLNLLVLRVDWGYEYESHPELRSNNPLTKKDIKKLVSVCRTNNIRLIPQINLFGHQSWHSTAGKLLEVYPEFDETPDIKLPEPGEYKWPNSDGLYCKSYCPLHPDVHEVVFALVDEIVAAFETDAFHAGLDEVFYIGHKDCPRCYGHDNADLFAGEVTKIRDHLAKSGTELWMWGDRLIDGKTTGIGLWEGSYNNTHRAIDMIPKDVVICDWHYERPDPTAFLFASKGFGVLTCPWQNANNAIEQEKMTRTFINSATNEMKPKYYGMLQTVWGSVEIFMKSYQGTAEPGKTDKSAECFKALSKVWNE